VLLEILHIKKPLTSAFLIFCQCIQILIWGIGKTNICLGNIHLQDKHCVNVNRESADSFCHYVCFYVGIISLHYLCFFDESSAFKKRPTFLLFVIAWSFI
jgi:hypothetical protein